MAKKKPIGAPSWGRSRTARAFGRCVLRRQQGGAAPFATQPQALPEARQRQQNRGEDADGFIARQQADQHGGNPHSQQRGDQRDLAPHAIAKVAEQRRADRARDKGDGEGGQRLQRRGGRVALWEEDMWKHDHRGGGIDVEVEELDGGTDQRGDDDFPAEFTGVDASSASSGGAMVACIIFLIVGRGKNPS